MATPPPQCFSCGNDLIDTDFDKFHELVQQCITENDPTVMGFVKLSENAAQKLVLDGTHPILKLSKSYSKICCRTMFLGDPYEYRKYMKLYDLTKVDEHVQFT